MEVINARSALLSNFEVLSLLRELESEQLAETRAVLAVKKERAENGQLDLRTLPNQPPTPEVCENLRTVEFEAIAHLSAPYQPVIRQTARGIQTLTRSLAPYGLTKGEKLQIVNLAPTEPVQLYVIVEELEDRLSEQMGDILTLVRDSLLETNEEATATSTAVPQVPKDEDAEGETVADLEHPDTEIITDDWEESGMMEYVDAEGAFEGDLDAEEIDE
ncbi:HRDC-like protein [Gautieria morchelliformis]|nr:HRDC-like protein [Gautieria morchelliformis]